PFVGFGDPILDGKPSPLRGLSIVSVYEGGDANIKALRRLPRLPNTSEELKRIGRLLGADEDSIYLREQATENRVKSMDLSKVRVIAFATHGLISGEFKGLSEPALVLTPPLLSNENDDGILTASEITQLRLDTDWIILSACNTAAGIEPGADGLSGLARSFFYAGARSLLVSHWPVESRASAELTTGIFESLKKNKHIGKSEVLRRSMLSMASKKSTSHPVFWAPFSLVGLGASQR
ncbi:MAG: hypothetical protein CMM30_04315, partial [Rhodospirillaceae bacterium]|nr:hypothetical protein [Rhodospirillaceae bacterium]